MSTTPLNIRVKIEEVTPIGQYIIAAFERDLLPISGKYKKYDASLLAKLQADHAAINKLLNPQLVTGKIAKHTQTIYAQQVLLQPLLTTVEGYIDIAQGLTVAPNYFGISAMRKSNANNDVEGVVDGIKILQQAIADNKPALMAEGLTAADITALQTISDTLVATKGARVKLEQEKQGLVDDNHIAINDFWASLTDICDKGKRVFKATAPVKLPDYTMSSLQQKVAKALQLNGLKGNITSAGQPLNGATIELLPLEAGRRRTAKSKNGGLYEIGSITAGKYIANITAKNHEKLTTELTIEDGQTLAKDFELKGV